MVILYNDKNFIVDNLLEAVEYNDMEATYKIITKYMPLINKYSRDIFTGKIDEDLKNTIIVGIFEKVPKFII